MRGDFGGRDPARRGERIFEHGSLRLVLLHLIAEKPRHGYELIKAIEDRLAGQYSPSPGVVYPTLTLLEELGYAHAVAAGGSRRRFEATPVGLAFLEENRPALQAMLARMTPEARAGRPPQIIRAIENLRTAMHLRLARAPLTEAEIEAIADLLDDTAKRLERL
ncbi:PadR family transcriptional regulator [Roseomonas sp. USHLN139]|uniref:PadR family transcriptional regulator n=1 Tax=Roseomonas sp. USHLN139 TaxID=3081298 RepID=UPI003B01B8FA